MLPKHRRLSTTYEYNKVRRLGKKIVGTLFDIFYLNVKDYDGPSRFGFVVTNKFSRIAPRRNRVKRVFREVVRLNIDKIKNGYWVVVHPKKVSEDKNYEEVNVEFNKVLSKVPFSC